MYQIYQIGPNESIDMIAKKVGISTEELRRINGIGENASLINGSYIIIPRMDDISIGDYSKYTVKAGDTMYNISKESNIDIDTLYSLNGLNKNDYIYPNQEILLPNRRTYVTKEETIENILKQLNVDIEKIGNLYVLPDQLINY